MSRQPNQSPGFAAAKRGRQRVVEIADLAVSREPDLALVTYSLGSCIGVAIWDPVAKVGGLLHYMLPESALAAEKARSMPGMFCDTGVPLLFKSAYELGAEKRRMKVKIAGGAQLLDEAGTFVIGKRNYLALRKLFYQNGVLIEAEDVGGSLSRTMTLEVGSGRVSIRSRGTETTL